MKIKNNKGFAISTLIYGLAIMGILIITIVMGLLSTNRSNTSSFAKSIEEELNRFSRTIVTYAPNGKSTQEFIVPSGEGGWYRVELWGAQGGKNSGGLGAYVSGIIKLEEGDALSVYVGHQGAEGQSGEESDIRILGGNYNSERSYETRIIVAAGGGSTAGSHGGTLYGYDSNMTSYGGLVIRDGEKTGSLTSCEVKGQETCESFQNTSNTLIGTLKTYSLTSVHQKSGLAVKPHSATGGGDGYIGSDSNTIGGVSFISGYAGSIAYVKGSLINGPKYTYYDYLYNESGTGSYDSSSGRDYYFYDGIMLPGVKSGDGKVRIERLIEETEGYTSLERKNTKLNNVRYIRDCVSGSNPEGKVSWKEIQAIFAGDNVAAGKTLSSATKSGYQCRYIDLGGSYNLDEIAVWHESGVDYKDNIIEVSADNSNWTVIKGISSSEYSETETVTGVRVSAYQPDMTTTLSESGNYYIIPVTSENRVVSAASTSQSNQDPITLEYLVGDNRQKWSIEQLPDSLKVNNSGINSSAPQYKIVELGNFQAMSLLDDENKFLQEVGIREKFNNVSSNPPQIWNITPAGNGTYVITTVVSKFDQGINTGNIFGQTNPKYNDNYNNIIVGINNVVTQRFKLYQLDF